MKKLDKIFVAAWLDSEGTLGLYKDKKYMRPCFKIRNNNYRVIFKLWRLLPGSHIYRSGRRCLSLELCKYELIYITLKALLPYLIVNRRKALEIINWFEKQKDIA